MIKWLGSRIFWGVAFIIGGALALLDNLGVVDISALFWVFLAGIGSVIFIGWYIRRRDQWWWLVPGISLLGIALASLATWIDQEIGLQWSGTIILGMVGISFLAIYLFESEHWWALIPFGTAVTVGVLSGTEPYFDETWGSGLFVIGLACTFSLVALLPSKAGEMHWAWIPAGILLLLGVFLIITGGNFLVYIIPILLIFCGVVLVYRYVRQPSLS